MFRALKDKLIMTFVAVAVVGDVLTKTLPMFHNEPTTVSQSQASNIEESYIKDVTVDSKNVHNNDTDKDLNLLLDVENSSDNSQSNNDNTNKNEATSSNLKEPSNSNNTNKKETISSNLEKSSNSNNTNKNETTSSNLEKSNNNNNTNKQETISSNLEKSSSNTNNQTGTNSQLKDTSSNVNTENKGSTNDTLEVKTPTIHYDRTTSIYANDNITLLRVEYYKNNKLTYYSVIEQFDATTKSYIEKIYQCNRETNIDPLIRTDVYNNGKLIKSY